MKNLALLLLLFCALVSASTSLAQITKYDSSFLTDINSRIDSNGRVKDSGGKIIGFVKEVENGIIEVMDTLGKTLGYVEPERDGIRRFRDMNANAVFVEVKNAESLNDVIFSFFFSL